MVRAGKPGEHRNPGCVLTGRGTVSEDASHMSAVILSWRKFDASMRSK